MLYIITYMAYIYNKTIHVIYMKKNPLKKLKNLFLKKKVLEIHDVMNAINATSRMTAYRYMKELGYLSSYTNARQFYTLKNIPEFDRDGLWHFGEVGFSKHGTLIDTIVHLIDHSKNGETSPDLEKQQRIYVQNALLSLVKAKKISRERHNGVYIYYSADLEISRSQMERRKKIGPKKKLPEWIVAEILIEIIRSLSGNVDEVAARLAKRGSLITREQIKQVFEENNPEKKTPD